MKPSLTVRMLNAGLRLLTAEPKWPRLLTDTEAHRILPFPERGIEDASKRQQIAQDNVRAWKRSDSGPPDAA